MAPASVTPVRTPVFVSMRNKNMGHGSIEERHSAITGCGIHIKWCNIQFGNGIVEYSSVAGHLFPFFFFNEYGLPFRFAIWQSIDKITVPTVAPADGSGLLIGKGRASQAFLARNI